jgi:hypothetical protein
MSLTPSIKLDQAAASGTPQPQEFAGFEQVRYEIGAGDYVHLYLERGGQSVAYHDGTAWQVTDGSAIGDSALDGTIWGVILGQAK